MVIQRTGYMAAVDQDASLHVSLHRVSGQVRTGDEANLTVGDRDFGMDAALGEGFGLVSPSIESRGRDQGLHLAQDIERDAAALLL